MVAEARERLNRAKNIDIVSFLSKAGYSVTETGGYYRCLSPLRNENQPSFDINKKTGRWKDRGNGKGGDLVDLVRVLYNKSFFEAIDMILEEESKLSLPRFEPTKSEKENIVILSVSDISTPYLMDYIAERKITLTVAHKWLKEAVFSFPNGKNPDRQFKALCFQNDSGGYELRSKFHKKATKPKNVTTVQGTVDNGEIDIWEGFFSWLSFLTVNGEEPKNKTVILNTITSLPAMLSFWGNKYHINAYLDNDKAGDDGIKLIQESGTPYTDKRYLFSGFNDYNDLICDKPIRIKKGYLSEILKLK